MDGGVRGHWSTCEQPARGTLAVTGAMVGTALAIDGLVIVWAAASLLDQHCGEDVAWLGLVVAGLMSSLAALVVIGGVARWWWRRRPPASARWAAHVLVTVVGASALLASVAVLWLPDGACP